MNICFIVHKNTFLVYFEFCIYNSNETDIYKFFKFLFFIANIKIFIKKVCFRYNHKKLLTDIRKKNEHNKK
ncbi:hypothetical protein CP964_12230 [Arcobacter defluvii]|uniref:Uncharacterized protein n=1 Tax=Arcobacter defluvii TaxID=873191 RepID=A0AAE7E7D5_9BACT|nr:hypothetical protein ADFLV_2347 [Arcobacter defluvii]RXI30198.1 hypothetical protein CP964_12230 [Arcobacter defluvii]